MHLLIVRLPYTIKEVTLRSALTRLRISVHNLAIERGRHERPPIPAEERMCTACDSQPVEDEFHFLLHCTKYSDDRRTMFE